MIYILNRKLLTRQRTYHGNTILRRFFDLNNRVSISAVAPHQNFSDCCQQMEPAKKGLRSPDGNGSDFQVVSKASRLGALRNSCVGFRR